MKFLSLLAAPLAFSSLALAHGGGGKKLAKSSKKGQRAVASPTPPVLSCPPGFLLDGSQCSRVLSEPALAFCRNGILDGDRCVLYDAAIPVCDGGYTLEGDACVLRSVAPLEVVCAAGYVLAGNGPMGGRQGYGSGVPMCSREVPVPLNFICPAGTVPEGDRCVSFAPIEPLFSCPPNYVMDAGGLCVTQEDYDCSPIAPIAQVQAPLYSAGGYGHGHAHGGKLRQLGGKRKYKKKGGYIPLPAPLPVEIPMPTLETFVVAQSCRRIETLPPLESCPPEAVDRGAVCEVPSYVAQLPECSALGGPDRCFDYEYVPASERCPPGFPERTPAGCVNTETVPFALSCAGGFLLENSRCVSYAPAELQCGNRYFGGKKHKGGFVGAGALDALPGPDGLCHRTEFAPAIVSYSVNYLCEGAECMGGGKGKGKIGGGHH